MTYQPGSEPNQQTAQYPPTAAPQGQYEQPQYQAQGQYQGVPQQRQRPHVHVRSTFLTTEFWVLVVLSLCILVASAVVDDDGIGGFGAHEAWKFITWLGIAYMISRGMTKFGGNRREGGEGGTRI